METPLSQDFKDFFICLLGYVRAKVYRVFYLFEDAKGWLASGLYRQRGRYTQPFMHSGLALMLVGGITLGPTLISETFPGLGKDPWQETVAPSAVIASAMEGDTATLHSVKPRSDVIEYEVKSGDTISTIADQFGISVDTIRWENNLKDVKTVKPGQVLRILPVTGVMHTVIRGDNIYTIAKKYQVDAQVIVDWPYNSFANDETFELTAGQTLMVPDGIMPDQVQTQPRKTYAQVPVAGSVVGSGQFAWPTVGKITQYFSWYHKALDIANPAAPDVLAADGGTVIIAGWVAPMDYGIHVIIDHGNGYQTLYGHMQKLYVSAGQKVTRGQPLGKMGSTGRSTGTHCHFEIRKNGAGQNPLDYLK
jgi:murein DD-endopeptidase MepM/ murein hydrolase activator NlpD